MSFDHLYGHHCCLIAREIYSCHLMSYESIIAHKMKSRCGSGSNGELEQVQL